MVQAVRYSIGQPQSFTCQSINYNNDTSLPSCLMSPSAHSDYEVFSIRCFFSISLSTLHWPVLLTLIKSIMGTSVPIVRPTNSSLAFWQDLLAPSAVVLWPPLCFNILSANSHFTTRILLALAPVQNCFTFYSPRQIHSFSSVWKPDVADKH